jgi:hypothetical protein
MIDPPVGAQVAHEVEVVIGIAHPVMAAIAIVATAANINQPARFHPENGSSFFYAKIRSMSARFSTTEYRYPSEYLILGITILVVILIIAFTAAATVCGSVIFIPLVVIAGYYASRNNHRALIAQAEQITPQTSSECSQ